VNLTAPQLKRVFNVLSNSDFDLAAGLREDEFNNFFAAHYKHEFAGNGGVYVGGGRLEDLKLNYSYKVETPVVIALSPLTSKGFARVLASWFSTVPELSDYSTIPNPLPKNAAGAISDPPPPNVIVRAPKMALTIKTDSGPQVTIEFSLRVTGYITATTTPNQVQIRITPIDARIDDPGAFKTQVDVALKKLGFRLAAGNDPDCIALRQVIFHIANVVLASKVASFVKELDLPVPIKLFDNVSIVSAGLDIVEKLVVVLAKVGVTSSALESSQVLPTGDNPEALKDATSLALKRAEAEFRESGGSREKAAKIAELKKIPNYPARGLFLLMHQRFFQLLADRFLVLSQSETGGGSWGPFFYKYGWSMKTWGPVAAVVGNGLQLSVNAEAGAWGEAGMHTHCGDISARLGASADALPAKFMATFYFDNNSRELWVTVDPQPFTLQWHIDGLPWPFNDLVAKFLDVFTDLGIAFIVLLGVRWKRKLTTLPSTFPGTSLQFVLTLDKQIVADPSSGALMAAGSVDFKP
jgi:hypothetical protein